ncbi:MAG: hypothetical protein AB7P40_00185 [Chloroflexota bacterium]
MNVVSVESTTRELWTPPPVTVIPVTSAPPKAPRRLTIMSAVVDAVCEMVALGLKTVAAGIASRQADELHDRHLSAVRRLAVRGAEDSSVLHGCPCWQRFMAIDQHGGAAQHHDAAEDTWIERMVALGQRLVQIGRGVNQRLEHEIGKRGGRRG